MCKKYSFCRQHWKIVELYFRIECHVIYFVIKIISISAIVFVISKWMLLLYRASVESHNWKPFRNAFHTKRNRFIEAPNEPRLVYYSNKVKTFRCENTLKALPMAIKMSIFFVLLLGFDTYSQEKTIRSIIFRKQCLRAYLMQSCSIFHDRFVVFSVVVPFSMHQPLISKIELIFNGFFSSVFGQF